MSQTLSVKTRSLNKVGHACRCGREGSRLELATADLSAYLERSKLVEERCILVDAQDRTLGVGEKKTCAYANVLLVFPIY